MKILSRGLIVFGSFFGMWLLLAQVNFVSIFGIENIKTNTENKIGDLIWEQIEKTEDVIFEEEIIQKLDSLLLPLCEENFISRDSLKVHVVAKDEVNAFALPDGHLVVYTGLILDCKNEQALLGVLGHEIAHIEKNHVMKKLSKEVGFSVLLSMTGANAQIIKEVLHSLSSSAYDRSLEKRPIWKV